MNQEDTISSNLESLTKSQLFSFQDDSIIKSDGSFRLFQGKTSVCCSIYGPTEQNNLKRAYETCVIDVQIKQLNLNDPKLQKYYEETLKLYFEEIIKCEKYPRTSITIILVVNSNDGSLLSCMKNCATMALLLNGLALKQIFWAFDISIIKKENTEIIYYPTEEIQTKETSNVNISLDLVKSNIGNIESSNFINKNLLKIINDESSKLIPTIRNTIKEYYSHLLMD